MNYSEIKIHLNNTRVFTQGQINEIVNAMGRSNIDLLFPVCSLLGVNLSDDQVDKILDYFRSVN